MHLKRVLLHGLLFIVCSLVHTPAGAAIHDGDITMDGQVNTVDVLWGVQHLFGTRSLSAEQFTHGDVAPVVFGMPQPDGLFSLGDVVVIFRIALGFFNFSFPVNQFHIGDSIGEGEAANGTIGQLHHETVWSTGYDGSDPVNAFNERFETSTPATYDENNAAQDPLFNHAVSGSVMADFAAQAQDIVNASAQTTAGQASMVSVLLGNNDVCAEDMAGMTEPSFFEAQYRAGLDVLAANPETRHAQIHVSGIPAIYWLWNAKRDNFWCRVFVWPLVPCQNLLASPLDDCESSISREDPGNVYPGDGPNCLRRKEFHRIIGDTYNPILRDVLEEYRTSGALPHARYTDIYDVRFGSAHVNNGDCFHPSAAGHALLAEKEWCQTHWGMDDPACADE